MRSALRVDGDRAQRHVVDLARFGDDAEPSAIASRLYRPERPAGIISARRAGADAVDGDRRDRPLAVEQDVGRRRACRSATGRSASSRRPPTSAPMFLTESVTVIMEPAVTRERRVHARGQEVRSDIDRRAAGVVGLLGLGDFAGVVGNRDQVPRAGRHGRQGDCGCASARGARVERSHAAGAAQPRISRRRRSGSLTGRRRSSTVRIRRRRSSSMVSVTEMVEPEPARAGAVERRHEAGRRQSGCVTKRVLLFSVDSATRVAVIGDREEVEGATRHARGNRDGGGGGRRRADGERADAVRDSSAASPASSVRFGDR